MENATNPHHHWIVDFFDTPTKSTKTLLGTWGNLLLLPCARNSTQKHTVPRGAFHRGTGGVRASAQKKV